MIPIRRIAGLLGRLFSRRFRDPGDVQVDARSVVATFWLTSMVRHAEEQGHEVTSSDNIFDAILSAVPRDARQGMWLEACDRVLGKDRESTPLMPEWAR